MGRRDRGLWRWIDLGQGTFDAIVYIDSREEIGGWVHDWLGAWLSCQYQLSD